MTDVDEFVENFLKHEYDPVKAREYYLRTRKLKGRQPGSSADRLPAGSKPSSASKMHPGSKVAYNGGPVPRGKRMEEDETPNVSPNGSKLVDYDGKGLGKATYADGSVYDPTAGWKNWQAAGSKAAAEARTKIAEAKDRASAPRERRVEIAQKKVARARVLANKVKDPKKRAALLQRLTATESKLASAGQPASRKGIRA